jgi:transposase
MIPPELQAEILRLYHAERWRVGTIAAQLHVHHDVVERVLQNEGGELRPAAPRPSMADPFVPFIRATLEKYPRLRASRLYVMVRERGYTGGPDHFRAVVRRHRPQPPAEAYLRLHTLPGEQAQVDWGHFGKLVIGRAQRALLAFVLVLSWSRQIFLRFFLGGAMADFLRGHVAAFEFLAGVPRVLLYDNLKSAVIERVDLAIRFNPQLLALAGHYRFLPRPVAVARGNEKGRVERAIRFIRDRFFAARAFRDLEDLNRQALAWCLGEAADRPWPDDRRQTVRQALDAERPRLLALPDNPFDTEECLAVQLRRTPYVRFDRNDYSVPHTTVRMRPRMLVVRATTTSVRILDDTDVVATHARSFSSGERIENPDHVQALVDEKRTARGARGMDRLHRTVPSSKQLFQQIAERGGNLGSTTYRLRLLLDAHGPSALEQAVAEALAQGVPHLGAIRHLLDRRRHERGLPPPLPLVLPDKARARDLTVRPHSLADYQKLQETPHAKRVDDPRTEPEEPESR